jgi:hypothetical protein
MTPVIVQGPGARAKGGRERIRVVAMAGAIVALSSSISS